MFEVGDWVKFIGCSKEQIQWGNNDDPTRVLEIGRIYKVINVEVHSQHTKIRLEGVPGRYNSVCFDTP